MTRSLALCALALACAEPRPTTPELRTRYRAGDFVVYRYAGAFTPAPVTLREQVLEQRGDRLTIEVAAARGDERRRWLQVVTDTPQNQRDNVVDELYELDAAGARRLLANPGNRDLRRLYEWTYVVPDRREPGGPPEARAIEVAGTRFACECARERASWRGRAIRLEACACPEFLWTHAHGRAWDEASGEEIWRVEVVEFGRAAR